MKKPVINKDSFALQHGSLCLYPGSMQGNYWYGDYIHPSGNVTIYLEKGICTIRACANGRFHKWTRRDHPSHRQISNFCRKLLREIQS